MTSWISMPLIPPGVPVVRSTRVSAMSCPRVRGSPAARRVSACRVRPAYTATPWRDGEQGGEVAHGVRGRAEADVPFGGGVAGPLGDGARVPAVGGGPGGGDDAPVPGAVERPGVGGEFGVDGGPVLGGQARGFLHQEGGAPFVELPGLQRGEGVGHFGDEGFGQAEEPAALGGGFTPGQGDLRTDPGAELGRGHPGVRCSRRWSSRRRRTSGPERGRRGLQIFQLTDAWPHPARHVPGGPDSRQRPGHVRDHHLASCRQSLVGPLIAVHGNKLSGTSDIKAPIDSMHSSARTADLVAPLGRLLKQRGVTFRP